MTNLDKQTDSAQSSSLVRRVTAYTAGCVIVSNMIGTGVFGTTGFMAKDLGNPTLILSLWLFGGIFSMLGAMCYSELGAAMPRAGGEYIYIREAYGSLLGFLSGWTSFVVGFSAAIALNAHLFAIHLCQLFAPESALEDNASRHAWQVVIALGMVWGLTAIHVAGVALGGRVQQVLTVIKVGSIVLLVGGGLTLGNGNWNQFDSATSSTPFTIATVFTSFLFVTFSYSGWNAAGYIAGEIVEPKRSIPRASIWGCALVCLLYVSLNAIYFYALPVDLLSQEPIEPVAQKAAVAMFGPQAARWITTLLTISILGATSAMIWAGPRVYYAMARDGVFPRAFAKTRSKGGAPAFSIVLQSGWVSVLVIVGGFEQLALYASFVLILFTALAVSSVFILRRKNPEHSRPFSVRPYPLVPLIFLAVSLAIMWSALSIGLNAALLGIVTVLVGAPFFYYWKSRHGIPTSDQ